MTDFENAKKIRLSLDVTPELNKTIEDLSKTIGGSKSDVLRKAIALMEVVVDYQKEGKKVGIANRLGEPMFAEIVNLL
ncbi:hypothetical protein NUACC21_57970 [Scytonema sp. NUACC21]